MESISFLSGNQDIFENEWYVNKLDKFGMEKVLNQENGRPKLRIKRLEEIFVCTEELFDEEMEDLDEDMEFENMTLREIQHLFKASENNKAKLISNFVCTLPSRKDLHNFKSFNCSSVDAFELQPISVDEANRENDCSESSEKMKHASSISLLEPEIAATLQDDSSEDEWTLEMWRSYNKQRSALHGALNYSNPPYKSADGFEENSLSHLATESKAKSPFNVVLPSCQLNAPSVNYEVLEDLNDDEGFLDGLSSDEISHKSYITPDPGVKLNVKNHLRHGISTISPKNKSVSEEPAIVTWNTSKLQCVTSSNFASSGAADMIHPMNERAHFELHAYQNNPQASAGDCKLPSNSSSLQEGISTLSLQSGGNFLKVDREIEDPRTMNISEGAIKKDNVKYFDNCRESKYLHVQESADAEELLPKSLTGCVNQRTRRVSEHDANIANACSENDASISVSRCLDPFLSTNVKFLSSDNKKPSLKDKEHARVVGEHTKQSKDRSFPDPLCLLSTEFLDMEERENPGHHKPPATIPCKRKAISPLSQEKLLHAMVSSDPYDLAMNDPEAFTIPKGVKEPAIFKKSNKAYDEGIQEWAECSRRKIQRGLLSLPDQLQIVCHGSPPLQRKRFMVRQKSDFQPLHIKSRRFSAMCQTAALTGLSQKPSPVVDQHSPPLHNASEDLLESRKGILKNSSQSCRGACRCQECKSLHFRVGKVSEFSQRQMRDIEGLANKLVKELKIMRAIVKENILAEPKSGESEPTISRQEVETATANAVEAEETAKKWLLLMARDCNRFCKIMRTQQRKLTFADEAGGQLCEVKLFHSPNRSEPSVHGGL